LYLKPAQTSCAGIDSLCQFLLFEEPVQQ
jgi:hypothetical protein